MGKAQIVVEIVLMLQGTDLGDFARQNLAVDAADRPVVHCALTTTLATAEGQSCKTNIVTALRGYSYRFTTTQLDVLADLYVHALDRLEPRAKVRVREAACDPASDEAQFDPTVAQAVCERLALDF
ncbi:MAG: hypothetical protein AB7O44_20250 [Hyphomicrobiaceae bacterium]